MNIAYFLKVNPEEYEVIQLNLFVRWCEVKSTSLREWQLLLNSNAVHQWFSVELRKRERQFIKDLIPYWMQTQSVDLINHYVEYAKKLDSLFLAPVQNKIRKQITKQFRYEDFNAQINLN